MTPKPHSTYDPHKAARVLVDAELSSREQAAQRHGVSTRTITRWRDRMDVDPVLSRLVVQKRIEADRAWLRQAPPMIEDALQYMRRCTTEGEVSPEMLRAVAGAVKLVSEAIASREIIDARIHQALGAAGAGAGQVVPLLERGQRQTS